MQAIVTTPGSGCSGARLFPALVIKSHEVMKFCHHFLVKRLPIMIFPSVLLFFCLISLVNGLCNCDIATLHTFPKSTDPHTVILIASCQLWVWKITYIPWGISFFFMVFDGATFLQPGSQFQAQAASSDEKRQVLLSLNAKLFMTLFYVEYRVFYST